MLVSKGSLLKPPYVLHIYICPYIDAYPYRELGRLSVQVMPLHFTAPQAGGRALGAGLGTPKRSAG